VTSEIITCARQDCTNQFTKRKHNQKYCSSECCRIATNANIMANYYAKQARLQGKERACGSCGVKLSRYNGADYCNKCSGPTKKQVAENVKGYLLGAI